jgi:ClpP class serine protease
MVKLFYVMQEELLKKYAETKDDIILAKNNMTAESISVAKDEIIKECQIYDFDPENTSNLYSVKDGVATIPVAGMLVQKVDICAAFFGETVTSYRFIQEATAKAKKDPAVKSIVYDINSGGGVVSGVDETAQMIRAVGKPTKSIVRDMAASAAYWIASATDEISIASNTAFIGSIGVAVEVINRDKADDKNGISRTVLTNTTSKGKRPNLATEDGQAILVDELNAIFDVFAESILIKRSDVLSREEIENLDGKVLIASEAVKYGLADSLDTLESSANVMLKSNSGNTPPKADVNKDKGANMSLQDFLKENPEAKAEYDEAIKAAKAEVIKIDRERCAKIAKLYGNNESAIKAMNDGTSVGDLAVAEKEKALEASKNAAASGADVGGLDKTKNGMPEVAAEEEEKDEKTKKADKALDKYLGKKEAK